jgi:hypothetical protein
MMLQNDLGIPLNAEQLYSLGSLVLRIRKLVKSLINVQRKAGLGGNSFRKAQAIVQKNINLLRSSATDVGESFASSDDQQSSIVLQKSMDAAVTRITEDLRTHGPKLRVYWWLEQLADAIPDEMLPEKGRLIKKLAKMVNELDDDEDLDEDELNHLLEQYEAEQQAAARTSDVCNPPQANNEAITNQEMEVTNV